MLVINEAMAEDLAWCLLVFGLALVTNSPDPSLCVMKDFQFQFTAL